MKKVFVVGAGGLMGSGIVQVCLEAGLQVTANDVTEEFVRRGVSRIEKALDRKIEKAKLTPEERDRVMGRLEPSTDLGDASDADIAIEAVFEDLELKKKVFSRLDQVCPSNTILASNSSSLSITDLASATGRPDRVVGMHFLQPVPVMPVVDMVRGLLTSDETYRAVEQLARDLGKHVIDWKDCPGHGGVQMPIMAYWNEAVCALFEERGTREDIDTCFRLGMGMALGPIESLDFAGLDTTLHILRYLYDSYGSAQFFPSPLLVQLVSAGLYGRKTGSGFYRYA